MTRWVQLAKRPCSRVPRIGKRREPPLFVFLRLGARSRLWPGKPRRAPRGIRERSSGSSRSHQGHHFYRPHVSRDILPVSPSPRVRPREKNPFRSEARWTAHRFWAQGCSKRPSRRRGPRLALQSRYLAFGEAFERLSTGFLWGTDLKAIPRLNPLRGRVGVPREEILAPSPQVPDRGLSYSLSDIVGASNVIPTTGVP